MQGISGGNINGLNRLPPSPEHFGPMACRALAPHYKGERERRILAVNLGQGGLHQLRPII